MTNNDEGGKGIWGELILRWIVFIFVISYFFEFISRELGGSLVISGVFGSLALIFITDKYLRDSTFHNYLSTVNNTVGFLIVGATSIITLAIFQLISNAVNYLRP